MPPHVNAHPASDAPNQERKNGSEAEAFVIQKQSGHGWVLAQAGSSAPPKPAFAGSGSKPEYASAFAPFGPRVKVRWDDRNLYVESNGLPLHGMMKGITAWQQQVPLPQNYTGKNAWQIPRNPVPAKISQSIKDRFLRGAVALAVNGIPIFNPQNNRGEISAEIGELDQWGGHCGRADDYHYHAAPLHLEAIAGKGRPIAIALDGYPLFGLTEPDGATPVGLDAYNGHHTSTLGYHYHASLKYPYVNGGFYGEVVEREGQVDPQPRAQPIRPALQALRGAQILGFSAAEDERKFSLQYELNKKSFAIRYSMVGAGDWKFEFTNADGSVTDQIYRAETQSGGGGAKDAQRGEAKGREGMKNESPDSRRPDESRPPPPRQPAPEAALPPPLPQIGSFALKSPVVTADGCLPVEFTGDGAGISPPLEWSGAPTGTKSYVLIMHHVDPQGKIKWYWTLYNLAADLQSLPSNAQGMGLSGSNSVNNRLGYAPPHSKGPGAKTYILTLYALSEPLQIKVPPATVNRELLLEAMKGKILAAAELRVLYTRGDRAP